MAKTNNVKIKELNTPVFEWTTSVPDKTEPLLVLSQTPEEALAVSNEAPFLPVKSVDSPRQEILSHVNFLDLVRLTFFGPTSKDNKEEELPFVPFLSANGLTQDLDFWSELVKKAVTSKEAIQTFEANIAGFLYPYIERDFEGLTDYDLYKVLIDTFGVHDGNYIMVFSGMPGIISSTNPTDVANGKLTVALFNSPWVQESLTVDERRSAQLVASDKGNTQVSFADTQLTYLIGQ